MPNVIFIGTKIQTMLYYYISWYIILRIHVYNCLKVKNVYLLRFLGILSKNRHFAPKRYTFDPPSGRLSFEDRKNGLDFRDQHTKNI